MITDANGPIKRINVNHTGAADLQTMVAAVSNRQLLVLGLFLANNGAADITFSVRDTDANILIGPVILEAKKHLVLPFNPGAWAETGSSKGLDLFSTVVGVLAGCLTYQEVGYAGSS